MREPKRLAYWRDDSVWVCPNHIPSVSLTAKSARCYYYNCPSVRPEVRLAAPVCVAVAVAVAVASKEEPAVVVKGGGLPSLGLGVSDENSEETGIEPSGAPVSADCAWFTCKNKALGVSKYCSVSCKNRFAHYREKERRKHLRMERNGGGV